ncbi:MAG: SBBP repeat-containing protein, partial [Acidobacteriota bacterium]|nr:SBBP repeat-containing protein [Acidobacteriota bacterium]
MRRLPSRRRIPAALAGIFGSLLLLLATRGLIAQTPAPPTGPQQLIFAGLRASTNPSSSSPYAQFNAVQSDASGNLFLLLDQKDGIRLLKTDPTATNILAQVQLGASGDVGLAMALDPAGNLYITGAANSGSLSASSGAAFPGASPGADNTFIGKFDPNLNEIFLTYSGTSRSTVTAIAATSDAVFITGSVFGATLPVTPSAIIQAPASGSLQNGFVEKFNATGTTLLYATYLSGQNGETAPAAIAADPSDHAYIAGYTTSSGYPTLAAIIPDILSPTSGFLTRLTPAGDGLLFSTFIPGRGISSLALAPSPQDSSVQTLLASGAIAPGQFPIDSVPAPLVSTIYQTLLRLPLDGSGILSSTLLAPGIQSMLTPGPNASVWIASNLTSPASLLPLTPLSSIGSSYVLRITQQNTANPQIDQAVRFGGVPTTNPSYASAPADLTSITTDPAGDPVFAGSISPTASANLLLTETYDFALYNAPTSALPSTIASATLPPGSCSGSLCAGSAAFLAKLNPATAAPSLALSTGNFPNLVLRNLGSQPATNLQFVAIGYTSASDCPATLPAGGECNLNLTGSGPGSLNVTAANAQAQTVTFPATTSTPNPIVFSPKELDFGVVTSTSPTVTLPITVTNLSQQPQPFSSVTASNENTPYTFAESFSDCPILGPSTKFLLPGASCRIILSFTASSNPSDDGIAQSNWTIGNGAVQLSAYTQAASLNVSATEIDFGTQFGVQANAGIRLPRYLYLSNNSSTPVT